MRQVLNDRVIYRGATAIAVALIANGHDPNDVSTVAMEVALDLARALQPPDDEDNDDEDYHDHNPADQFCPACRDEYERAKWSADMVEQITRDVITQLRTPPVPPSSDVPQ